MSNAIVFTVVIISLPLRWLASDCKAAAILACSSLARSTKVDQAIGGSNIIALVMAVAHVVTEKTDLEQ